MTGIRPLKPTQVRYWVARYVQDYFDDNTLRATSGQKGAIRKHLHEALPDDDLRHLTLGWLFTTSGAVKPLSTGELVDCQWFALKRWIGAKPMDPSAPKSLWAPDVDWLQEVQWCSWEAKSDQPVLFGTSASAENNAVTGVERAVEPPLEDGGIVDMAVAMGGKVTDCGPATDHPLYKPTRKVYRSMTYTFDR